MAETKKSPTMNLMKKAAAPAAAAATTEAAAPKAPAKPKILSTKPAPKTETKAVEKVETAQAEGVDTSAAESLDNEDLIVKTAHEIENIKEDKAFKLVPQLLNNIDHDYFRLGGVLSVIQVQGWYMDRGYENFRNFVESESGMAYRKAMYLIAIYNGLVESGVAWVKVKDLGWTKLKELASILTPENVDDWVAKAAELTVLQLQEHIKTLSAASPKEAAANGAITETTEASKTTTITFKLHEDQKQTVREALDKCKHEAGTDVDSVALENICLDFLGGSKLKTLPTLKELMEGKSAEEVLQIFTEVFPDVELTATVVEEGEGEAAEG